MESITLDTAFVDHGVPHVAFWNGRVLTAEDLRGEQLANQLGRNRLGRAIGSGVVSGLAVLPGTEATRVEVRSGLAVDRTGQVVDLPVDVDLSLVVPVTTAQGDGVFTVCEPLTSNSPTGTGLYLLVIRPASDSRSSVAGVPALGSGVASECGPKYTVDGVSFRLIGIDPVPLAGAVGMAESEAAELAVLGSGFLLPTTRNLVAHLFLDTRAWAMRLAHPFDFDPASTDFGALTNLPAGSILPCEVPIALLTWSFDGVGEIDNWSVRRTPSPEPALTAVQGLGSRRRAQLGRASYCQFQDQLSAVVTELAADTRVGFRLPLRFRYLPAAGLVPMERSTHPGFSTAVFDGLVIRGPVPLDSARVGALLDESFHHAAVDTAAGEVLNVYSVSEPGSDELDYLVFCTSRIDLIEDKLAIDSVFPAGILSLGQRIEIRGRNFGFTTGDGRIEFDGQNANALAGSTDTKLIVDVPINLEVEPEGSEVKLEVSSDRGSDSVPLTIGHPGQQPIGQLHVSWLSVTPKEIVAGKPLSVKYSVLSAVVPPVDVELVLDGTDAVVEVATLLDGDGNEITGPVHMAADDEIFLEVRVRQVPDVDDFALSLAAKVGDIVDDDTRVFVVGEPTIPTDPDITLLTGDLDPDPGSEAVLEGSKIRLADQSVASLEVVVRVKKEGLYEVRVVPSSDVGPWVSLLADPDPGLSDPPVGELLVTGIGLGGFSERTVVLTFQRQDEDPAEPSPPRTLILEVRRERTVARATSVTYTLEPL